MVDTLRNDPEMADHIRAGLQGGERQSAEQELEALGKLIAPKKPAKAQNVPRAEHLSEVLENGLKLTLKGKKIEITGAGVNAELLARVSVLLKDS